VGVHSKKNSRVRSEGVVGGEKHGREKNDGKMRATKFRTYEGGEGTEGGGGGGGWGGVVWGGGGGGWGGNGGGGGGGKKDPACRTDGLKSRTKQKGKRLRRYRGKKMKNTHIEPK